MYPFKNYNMPEDFLVVADRTFIVTLLKENNKINSTSATYIYSIKTAYI